MDILEKVILVKDRLFCLDENKNVHYALGNNHNHPYPYEVERANYNIIENLLSKGYTVICTKIWKERMVSGRARRSVILVIELYL